MSLLTRVTFVTTTTYGSWLPGDLRGYVRKRTILPCNPRLLDHARARLSAEPVSLTAMEIDTLDRAMRRAAAEFEYRLTDLSIEPWHLHWIVEHGADSAPVMVGRLKTRMRQAVDRGRIWTEGYCHRPLYSSDDLEAARAYIARHKGCRMTAGRDVSDGADPPAKPGAE